MFPVTPATRTELRRLKSNFDAALARLDGSAKRESDLYLEAREAYGLWRVAIDKYGTVVIKGNHEAALLDTLDALEATASPSQIAGGQALDAGSPIEPLTAEQQADVRVTFHDIDQMDEMMRLIAEPL